MPVDGGARRGETTSYDAFLSYSHAHDGRLVPALHTGLERFAKRWYQLRALRIFYDSASLSAAPELWGAIEHALSRSSWFVLLASPDAARSDWVAKEVDWWVEHRSADRIIVVATGPGFDWTETDPAVPVVPPSLRRALRTEPRWIDLGWLSEAEQIDQANPRFRDAIAEIGAPLHGVDKDMLVGTQIREHRRTMRIARAAVAALAALALVAVSAALVAVAQRDEARSQARLATSRQLAATSRTLLPSRLDLARLLAVEAHRLDRNVETRAALLDSLTSSPSLSRFLAAGRPVTALGTATGSGTIVAGGQDGTIVRWEAGDRRSETAMGSKPVVAVAASVDGAVVAAADGTDAVVWTGGEPARLGLRGAVAVAVSPTGQAVAVLDQPTPVEPAVLRLVDRTGRPLASVPLEADDFVRFASEDELVSVSVIGGWQRWSVPDLRLLAGSSDQLAPAGGFVPAVSPQGDRFAFAKNNQVALYTTGPVDRPVGRPPEFESKAFVPTGQAGAVAVTADGQRVAVANAAIVHVSEVGPVGQVGALETRLDAYGMSGGGTVGGDVLAFVDAAGDSLVSASGELVAVWDLTSGGPLRTGTPVVMPDGPTASPEPRIAVAPDSRRAAVVGPAGALVADLETGSAHGIDGRAEIFDFGVPLWNSDGTVLYLAGTRGPSTTVTGGAADLRVVPIRLTESFDRAVLAAALSPDGQRIVMTDSLGAVWQADTADGRTWEVVPATGAPPHGGPWPQATGWAAARPDAAAVARLVPDGVLVTDLASGMNTLLDGPATEVVYSGGHLVIERADGRIELRDAANLGLVGEEAGGIAFERARALTPDGSTFLRLDEQGQVLLTETATGAALGSIQLPYAGLSSATNMWAATSLALDPSGRYLVTGSSGGLLVRWVLDEAEWVPAACGTAGHDLTPAEWQNLTRDEPPSDLRCGRSAAG